LTQADKVYAVFGCTAIDWVQRAMSLELGLAESAKDPECGLDVVTLPAGQDHPDRLPVSKPALVTRLVAADAAPGVSRRPIRTTSRLVMTAAWGRCAGGFMAYKL
jgi:hypothetical protein